MTRYTGTATLLKDGKLTDVICAYGYDHAVGYFIQLIDPNSPEDELILDIDSVFNDLTGPKLADILSRSYVEIPKEHHTRMMADLEF